MTLMTGETYAHIREDVRNAMVENRNDDPSLLPELVMRLLDHLGDRATDLDLPWGERRDHAGVLEQCQLRAVSQIPFGEADACDQDDDPEDHRDR